MKRIIFFIALIVSACSSNDASIEILDSNKAEPLKASGYYEKLLNSKQWLQTQSFDERMEACQFPEEMIRKMSTDELIIACITHPLAQLYMAFQNEFEIVDILFKRANVYNALLMREDAAQRLISFYEKSSVQSDLKQHNIQHADTELTFCQMHLLELLIASGYFPTVFDQTLENDLRTAASNHLALRRLFPDIYSIHSKDVAFLILRELNASTPFSSEKARLALEEIHIQESRSSQTKAGGDPLGSTYFYTPRGTSIYGLLVEDYSAGEKANIDLIYCQAFPNATLIETTSCSYNHHCYAWNLPVGGYELWFPSPSYFITDSSYVCASLINADVVLSESDDFSAIPTATSGIVISKWPNGPVMQHAVNDSPFNVTGALSYYRINWSSSIAGIGSSGINCGVIDGEDLAPVGIKCNYTYYPSGSSFYHPSASFEWDIQNSHSNPSDYSYSQDGSEISITFNVPGEYYLNAYYLVNGYYMTHKELLVLASYEFNNIAEPDSTAATGTPLTE